MMIWCHSDRLKLLHGKLNLIFAQNKVQSQSLALPVTCELWKGTAEVENLSNKMDSH